MVDLANIWQVVDSVNKIILQYQQALLTKQHRGVVLLVGDEYWYADVIKQWFLAQHTELVNSKKTIYCYAEPTTDIFKQLLTTHVDNKNFRQYLGTEASSFIYASDDIQPDVFSALAGTVVAGGLLFICWQTLPDEQSHVYLQRFYRQLQQTQVLLTYQQHENEFSLEQQTTRLLSTIASVNLPTVTENFPYGCLTNQQVQAVDAIINVVTGHRNRPLILTADRGRGKTTALALACVELLNSVKRPLTILITASNIGAVDGFFLTITKLLAVKRVNKQTLQYQQSSIRFLPIDVILADKPAADLLLVDEAAAIPLYLLNALFSHYHRLVFSSTLHGYEGAGRGFALKFNTILADKKLLAKQLTLVEPIRWAKNDPLEQFVFDACLLNANLTPLTSLNYQAKPAMNDQLKYHEYLPADLLADEKLLRQLFAVLVTAHYQTSPNDLLLLLNHPQLKLRVVSHQVGDKKEVLAVALIMTEGILGQEHGDNIEEKIRQGQRRLKDQFLPQSLIAHCGAEQAFDYSYWRIMRIAVHPQQQNQGLGQYLLTCLEQEATANKIDVLGTSFALNKTLLNFWQKRNWQMVRIGFTKDHASGEHSGLLIKALTARAEAFILPLVSEFYRTLPFLLSAQYQQLPAGLLFDVLQKVPENGYDKLTRVDEKNIEDFANGYRQFDPCAFSLHLALLNYLKNYQIYQPDKDSNNETLLYPFIARLLQKHSVKQLCNDYGFSGKKQINHYFIQTVKALFQ